MKNIDEELFKKNIAQKVKLLRNTSQEALAETADISEDTISKTEREISIMNSLTLVKICNALQVTPNDILEDFIDMKNTNDKIVSEIALFSDEDKEFLLDTIDYIKRKNKRK